MSFEHLTRQTVTEFLDWLQVERHCTNSTRNQRLTAINSFVKYAGYQNPACLNEVQQVLAVKQKRTAKPVISHLTVEGIILLLKQPDGTTNKGLRDLALLSLMYESAARVQEIIDLTPSSLFVGSKPYRIELLGKGNKHRIVNPTKIYNFNQVKDLRSQGLSCRAIARALKICRKTVNKYLSLDSLYSRKGYSSTNFDSFATLLM